jgi:hypothetical protein
VAALLDFTDPIAPQYDLAFAVPTPGNPLAFLFPASGRFTVHVSTEGVVQAALVGLQTFVSEALDGTLRIIADRIAEDLHRDRTRPLARLLLAGQGPVAVIDGDFVLDRLVRGPDALLPTSAADLAGLDGEALDDLGDLIGAMIEAGLFEPPPDLLDLPEYVSDIATALTAPGELARMQLYLPGLTEALVFDANGQPSLQASGDRLEEIVSTAYFSGIADVTVLSVPLARATVDASPEGVQLTAELPWLLAAEARIGVGTREQNLNDLIELLAGAAGFDVDLSSQAPLMVDLPVASATASLSLDRLAHLLQARLGLPAAIFADLGLDADAHLGIFSPGFGGPGAPLVQRNGGIEFGAELDIADFIDDASFAFTAPLFTDIVPDFQASAHHVDGVNIPGVGPAAPAILDANLDLALGKEQGVLSMGLDGSLRVLNALSFDVDGSLTIDTNLAHPGLFGDLDLAIEAGQAAGLQTDFFTLSGNFSFVVNTTDQAHGDIRPGPILGLHVDGTLVLGDFVDLEGEFDLLFDANGFRIRTNADFELLGSTLHAAGDLTFDATTPALFGSLALTLGADASPRLGDNLFSLDASFALEVDSRINLLRVHADGALSLLNHAADMTGVFDLTMSSTGFSMHALGDMGVAGLGSLHLAGHLTFQQGFGLFDELVVQGGVGLGSASVFRLSGTGLVQLNTTGADPPGFIPAGPFVRVHVNGAMDVLNVAHAAGDFDLTLASTGFALHAVADMSVATIGSLHLAGDLQFTVGGPLSGSLEIQGGLSLGNDVFALDGGGTVEFNTDPPGAAAPFVTVHAAGDLDVLGGLAGMEGTFDLRLATTGFAMAVNADLGVGPLGSLHVVNNLTFTASTGRLAGLLAVQGGVNLGATGILALTGSGSVEFDTDPPGTADPFVEIHVSGDLRLLGDAATLHGTFDLLLETTGFAMAVDASLGGPLGSLSVDGHLTFRTTGGIRLFGQLEVDQDIDFGPSDVFRLTGNALVQINTCSTVDPPGPIPRGPFVKVHVDGDLELIGGLVELEGDFDLLLADDRFEMQVDAGFEFFDKTLDVGGSLAFADGDLAGSLTLKIGSNDRPKVTGDFFSLQGAFSLEVDTEDLEVGIYVGSVDGKAAELKAFGVFELEGSLDLTLNAHGFDFDTSLKVIVFGDDFASIEAEASIIDGRLEGRFEGDFGVLGDISVRVNRFGCLHGFGPVDIELIPGACDPRLYIDDQTVKEADSNTIRKILVELSSPAERDLVIDYHLEGKENNSRNSADEVNDADNDFDDADGGSVTISKGSTSAKIDVRIIGDNDDEGNETFRVIIDDADYQDEGDFDVFKPSDPSIFDDEALITILDNDDPAPITIRASLSATSAGRGGATEHDQERGDDLHGLRPRARSTRRRHRAAQVVDPADGAWPGSGRERPGLPGSPPRPAQPDPARPDRPPSPGARGPAEPGRALPT